MRRHHLRFVPFLLLPVLPHAAGAQQRVAETRPASPTSAVRIQNLAGSVRVAGWDRDSIAVSGSATGKGSPVLLHVSGANAKVWVDEGLTAQLEVRVPARSRVWVRTSEAAVSVTGVQGGVDVSTVSGAIEVRGEPAELYAESMGGAVVVEVDTRLLRARTAGSDITVRGRVADAEAYTVTGLITVTNKQVERGRFESVDGGIRYRGGIARTSSVEFVSHAGDIELALPASLAADVHISSFQGTVRSELGKLVRAPGGGSGAEYSLTLDGGGAEVTVRTFKGAVRLTRM